MTPESPARFDPEAIARLRRFGGDALLFQMIDVVVAAAPGRLAAVREGVARADAPAARAALHALKSSAGQLGAVTVQGLCERGERLAGGGDVAGVTALMPLLESESEAMLEWLASIRAGGR
ncbi:MAG: Hpt domain-containing protein [Gemmatimonadota bacterium]|nr:Hpt domain-containing protein [Gemmatimonadota bacterium]